MSVMNLTPSIKWDYMRLRSAGSDKIKFLLKALCTVMVAVRIETSFKRTFRLRVQLRLDTVLYDFQVPFE